ncbi:hypothetical protein [Phaeobacter inhibens]|uniref:hypothetical protein n=1 Tax=Phaeobacter inhibens TaxID=221822 RepID=UPI000C9B06AA|nr:hypothetical protein [Phaeobacter inhibens]AUQ65260.1 type I secretion membrane fusion protein, HlyD family [Phaeobacter inhibens]
MIATLAVGLIWAANAELLELAYAKGTIVPASYPRPVEHLDGGILAEILVQEGQQVDAGAPLVRLSEALVDAEYRRLTIQEAALARNTARLRAVIDVIEGTRQAETARRELEPGHRLLAQLNAFESARNRIQQRITQLERALEIEGNRLRALSAVADGERGLMETRREEEEFVASISDRLLSEL